LVVGRPLDFYSIQDIIRLVSSRVLKCCRLTHREGATDGRDKVEADLQLLMCFHGNYLGGVYYVAQDKRTKSLNPKCGEGGELVSPYLCDHTGVRQMVPDFFSPLSHMDEILADSNQPHFGAHT
jgi:hypothetical protein